MDLLAGKKEGRVGRSFSLAGRRVWRTWQETRSTVQTQEAQREGAGLPADCSQTSTNVAVASGRIPGLAGLQKQGSSQEGNRRRRPDPVVKKTEARAQFLQGIPKGHCQPLSKISFKLKQYCFIGLVLAGSSWSRHP